MTSDPLRTDQPPAPMPATPPLDWPAPPAPPQPHRPGPERWEAWQVALIAVACLLAGALAGVLLIADDADDDADERAAPTTQPSRPEADPTTPTIPPGAVPGEGPAPGSLGSEDEPAPLGSEYLLGDWAISGWSVDPDAAAVMQAYDPTNPLPRPQHRFVLAGTDLTYIGPARGNPADLKLYAQDPTGRAYLEGCGAMPAPLLAPAELGPGDTITGQVCFEVPEQAATGLRLVVEVQLGVPIFFQLT